MSITFGTIISDWKLVVSPRGNSSAVIDPLNWKEREREAPSKTISNKPEIIILFVIYRKSVLSPSLLECSSRVCSASYSGWFWGPPKCLGDLVTFLPRKWREGSVFLVHLAASRTNCCEFFCCFNNRTRKKKVKTKIKINDAVCIFRGNARALWMGVLWALTSGSGVAVALLQGCTSKRN